MAEGVIEYHIPGEFVERAKVEAELMKLLHQDLANAQDHFYDVKNRREIAKLAKKLLDIY